MQYAVTLAKSGRYAEARIKADAVIAHTDSSFKDRDLFINNACYVYGKYVETLMGETKFPEARKLLVECPAPLRGTGQMNGNLQNLYCTAADSRYKEEKYRDAIALYTSALPFCDKPSSIAAWNNIQSAFLNLSRQYLLRNNRAAAEQTLKECMEKVPDCSKCKERLSTMH
jgi:tetratricopeptide (TPR) repeat protein